MPRIDAYSLKLFVSTARAGSITRAAAEEHIAASALSRRLADLEHAVGMPLLTRSVHGVTLTDAGRIVYERGLQIDDGLQALVREVQLNSDVIAGTLRIAANASAVVGFLPERIQAFCSRHPQVEIALQERLSDEVIRDCLADQADVGIGAASAVPAGLDSWWFADDPLMLILPPGHALAGTPEVSFSDIAGYPLIGIQSGGALDQLLHEQAGRYGKRLHFSVSVNSFDAVCRMVEAGLGIAVTPLSAASAYAGTERFVRKLLTQAWARRELRLYALRKTPRPRAVSALLTALQG
jgi:DNA-binding transcriptional LysR family regulator